MALLRIRAVLTCAFCDKMASLRSCEVLSEDQKQVVRTFYNKWMNSTSKDKHELMLEAAEKTGTSYKKVKVANNI